jgi:transcriptional regulator with XRE-family HTH domain
MEDYFDSFRINLKYYRELKGWSQRDLYIQSGISSGNIGNIEAGCSKPSFETIIGLASALGVHPADLFLRDCSVSKLEMKKQIEEVLAKDIHDILEKRF